MNSKNEEKFCHICLSLGKLYTHDKLSLCSACFEKVKLLEKEKRIKISKEQTAGSLKDEL